MTSIRNGMASIVLAVSMLYASPPAIASDDNVRQIQIDLPSQALSSALLAAGELAKRQIIFPGEEMAGLRAPAIHGTLTTREVIERLLADTAFSAEYTDEAIYIRGRSQAAPTAVSDAGAGPNLFVTGSRIRGAISSSPIFKYEAEKLREQGVSDMTALAAAIPQNFMGGQSPAIGSGAEGRGSLVGNGSTSLNLRGLGPEATLTLVNGHRIAYNQNISAVDLASIPFAAVERVEIMPDGASAIYGSDAIAGVANIILKRDFDGVWANATIGGATSGGYLTQRFSAVTGTRWDDGGVMVTGNYDRNTKILARDRDFTSDVNPDVYLYPEMETIGFVASAHQQVGDRVSFNVDGFYSERRTNNGSPYTDALSLHQSGTLSKALSRSFNIAPSMAIELGRWDVEIAGVYGTNDVKFANWYFPTGANSATHRNDTYMGEVSAEGPLIALPAGDVRLAIGAGYRKDKLVSALPVGTVRGAQHNAFAYGELNIPLAAPQQAIWGVYRANIDAALRFEDYGNAGRVAVPRFGASVSPTPDFDLKASWGKSFRVPTLFQQNYPASVLLFPSFYWDASLVPDGRTVMFVSGGNADLEPERAQSISATLAVHPQALAGLELSATYFKVKYKNRIAEPMVSLVGMLADPIFGNFVQLAPSIEQILDTIDTAPNGLEDFTGSGTPFDPSGVHAIIDNRYHNIARSIASGVDLSASYLLKTAEIGTFTLQAGATYLDAQRTLVSGGDSSQFSGRIFTPARFRGRAALAWSDGPLTVNATVSHVGSVLDDRRTPYTRIEGVTTTDLSIKRRFGGVEGLDVQVAILNLFNAKPDIIRATGTRQPYDFTNYSAIGRQVSFSLSKAW